MSTTRSLLGMLLAFGIAQSCTNDFDKFELGDAAGAASSTGGKLAIGGSAPGSAGKMTNQAGTTLSLAGTTGAGGSTGGNVNGSAGAVDTAGATGLAGAAGAPGQVCELPVTTDVSNCGDCGRACATEHVAGIECTAGVCSSSCEAGFANCRRAEPVDDGCETPVTSDPANCGGCGNHCPSNFVCKNAQCGCDFKNDCGNGGGVGCVNNLCTCDLSTCRPGERCRDAQGSKVCSCSGSAGASCLANEFCCESAGCTDVLANASNCGACGRVCTRGFICATGACQCDSVEDCGGDPLATSGAGGAASEGGAKADGGATSANVACVAGLCVCNGSTCAEGQRCLASGSCG